jgi:kynureninase
MTDRIDCEALDRADPLAPLRDLFALPDGLIYLDGNSLGVLPKTTAARVARVVSEEWGRDLIRSWNTAGWIDLPLRVGDAIGTLVGARGGELLAADSTSVNLYKVLACALRLVQARDATGRRRIVLSERTNFPTDLYIADTLCRDLGFRLVLVDEATEIAPRLGDDTAVLMLTQVHYRTGALHDMAALSAAAHAAGALTVWDLAHSAGALPVDLHGDGADFAVGCGYKYLNGGPGAPAFVWVRPDHLAQLDALDIRQPLAGWIGHAAPFLFTADYRPAPGIGRFQCGTPPVLSMTALEEGVRTLQAAQPLGGMAALRAKSQALTRLFLDLVDARCGAYGVASVTPRDPARRGSQVSLTVPEGGYAVVQALIERGVIGDFRAGGATPGDPDLLRFGFTPLYTRFVDVWDAVEHLRTVLADDLWRAPRFQARAAVT